jgi:hypothetical protein
MLGYAYIPPMLFGSTETYVCNRTDYNRPANSDVVMIIEDSYSEDGIARIIDSENSTRIYDIISVDEYLIEASSVNYDTENYYYTFSFNNISKRLLRNRYQIASIDGGLNAAQIEFLESRRNPRYGEYICEIS